MSTYGFVRAVLAAQRRMEREELRQQRELLRRQKEYDKMLELEKAAYEVEVYENTISLIDSIHKECSGNWDWKQIAATPSPVEPINLDLNETAALKALNSYKPSIMDKIFKRVETNTLRLTRTINEAKQLDTEIYDNDMKKYKSELSEWRMMTDLANGILTEDQTLYVNAIVTANPFEEIELLGSTFNFIVENPKVMTAVFFTNGMEVIPQKKKTLTKTGKLSIRDIPAGQINEIYQDYICGCILRIGRELFTLLPLDLVIVTVEGGILNTSTGFVENMPILSVGLTRETIEGLNFEALDPSDSMRNFKHNMEFKKATGFEPVSALQISDFK